MTLQKHTTFLPKGKVPIRLLTSSSRIHEAARWLAQAKKVYLNQCRQKRKPSQRRSVRIDERGLSRLPGTASGVSRGRC